MKNVMKKTLSAAMAITMISASVVFATDDKSENIISNEVSVMQTRAKYDCKYGKIKEINDNQITLDVSGEEVILNCGDETELLSKDLMPISLDNIKNGMFVCSINKPMMTKSIPVQLPAVTVIVSEDENLPIYTEVASVETDSNNNVFVASADNSYLFEITDECNIAPLKTRDILSKADMSKGDRLLVYTDILTLSLPAKAAPAKVVVLENCDGSDIIVSEWAEEYIQKGTDEGWLSHNEFDGKYTENISREKFCDILYASALKHEKEIEGENKIDFTDVKNDAVEALGSVGIIEGTGENSFSPDKSLTREEAATILCRAANYFGFENKAAARTIANIFADADKISDWAKDSVSKINDYRIMIGTDNGEFNPSGTFTVEQAVTTITRLYGISE